MDNIKTSKKHERGSALVEFALCFSLFWMPLFLGTYEIGFSLMREVQLTQVCRDAGHMYSQGTDFSQPEPRALLTSLAPANFRMSPATASPAGNTVLYLSTVLYVDDSVCPKGVQRDGSKCPNYKTVVFTRQIPVGNTSLHKGNFGGPNAPGAVDASYNVLHPLTDPNAVATGFPSAMLTTAAISSNSAYMSEMYVNSPDLSFWSYLGTPGEYARSIF
ncbi:MAG: pilus assembly protein [Acidobacteriota bacterium]|nr:pilus assembly protein [Acidobacteriota bacterium]